MQPPAPCGITACDDRQVCAPNPGVRQASDKGTAVFVASDHCIPDAAAIREMVIEAVAAAAHGQIVTMGMAPTSPSFAYGYIQSETPSLSRVRWFVEKPGRAGPMQGGT